MLETFTCLTTEHDWRLLLAAVLVCAVGLATALRLFVQALRKTPRVRLAMQMTAGLISGGAIWTTHFTAMLAYQPGVPVEYEALGTLGSLAIIIAGSMAGLALAGALRFPTGRILGGAVIGSAVAAMHYVGMAAISLPGVMSWNVSLASGGVAVGVLFWAVSLTTAGQGGWRRVTAATLLASLGVCSLHFTGMGALTVTSDPSILVAGDGTGARLATGVAAAAAFIVAATAVVEALAFWSRASMLNQLREAIDAMPDGLAFFDAHDRLVIWNARYEEVNPEIAPILKQGLSFRDLIRFGVEREHYPDAKGREDEWVEERLKARARLSCTLEQQTDDNRWLRVQDRRTADGGVVTLVNDITDLKRDAEVLAAARDAAEAANRAKSEFLANMSHEIRTPLNGVIGVAQALAGTELNDRQQQMLELIRSSGATLQHLLSDILDLARVESGRLQLSKEPFDLAKAVREAAHLYAAQAEEKGLRFFVEMAPDCDVWVDSDMVRLKQILTNLVSNAVKFTTQGFVSLTVSRGQDGGGGATFRFSIEDTGIGFDSNTRARLFSRFEQADGAITRRYGGTGLGLAICRELAGMMQGDLDCESEPGGGSTFILSVPMSIVAAPERKEPELADMRADAVDGQRPLRVLLADDHPTNRKVVELILSQIEAKLVVTEDGAQALTAFRDNPFDVVLMDMQMPVMDGLTATREIRLHEDAMGASRTPVVMLTANALPEHISAAREAGADRHLSKPFSAVTLIEVMQELCGSEGRLRAA